MTGWTTIHIVEQETDRLFREFVEGHIDSKTYEAELEKLAYWQEKELMRYDSIAN